MPSSIPFDHPLSAESILYIQCFSHLGNEMGIKNNPREVQTISVQNKTNRQNRLLNK